MSGGDDSGHFEPMLRYRHGVTDIFAVGVVGYGTHARDSFDNASYSLTRGGLEAGFDLRAAPKNRYIEVHVMGGGSVTGLWAKGRYCHTEEGYGIECEGMPANVKAEVAGAYPSLFVGLALEVANRLGFFHGLRVQTLAATGTMPSVRYGEQRSATSWMALGLGIGVAFGAPDREE